MRIPRCVSGYRLAVALGGIGLVVLTVARPESWAGQLAGLGTALTLSCFAGCLLDAVAQERELPPLIDPTAKTAVVVFPGDNFGLGPFFTGLGEAVLFFASASIGRYELAAGWLVFKTGAKWSSWQHIMRMPDGLRPYDSLEFLRFRHAFASRTATNFTLGTLASILAGVGGYALTRFIR